MGKASLTGVYDRLNAVTPYHPLSVDTFSDWTTEAGDIVTVKREDKSYSSPVFSMNMTWRGQPETRIESGGNRERKPVSKLSQAKYAENTIDSMRVSDSLSSEVVRATNVENNITDLTGIRSLSSGQTLYGSMASNTQAIRDSALTIERNQTALETWERNTENALTLAGVYTSIDADGMPHAALVASKEYVDTQNDSQDARLAYATIETRTERGTDGNLHPMVYLIAYTKDLETGQLRTFAGMKVDGYDETISLMARKVQMDQLEATIGEFYYIDTDAARTKTLRATAGRFVNAYSTLLTTGQIIQNDETKTNRFDGPLTVNNTATFGGATSFMFPVSPTNSKELSYQLKNHKHSLTLADDGTLTSGTAYGYQYSSDVKVASRSLVERFYDPSTKKFKGGTFSAAVTFEAGVTCSSTVFLNGTTYVPLRQSASSTTTANQSIINHYHTMTADSNGKVTMGTAVGYQTNFNIADTAYFKTQVSAALQNGKNAMGVTVDTDKGTVKVAESSTKSMAVTALAGLIYDSTTHSYVGTATAKVGSTNMASSVSTSSTQGYTDGQKSVGVSYNSDYNRVYPTVGGASYSQISNDLTVTYKSDQHQYLISGHALIDGVQGPGTTKWSGSQAYTDGQVDSMIQYSPEYWKWEPTGVHSVNPAFETGNLYLYNANDPNRLNPIKTFSGISINASDVYSNAAAKSSIDSVYVSDVSYGGSNGSNFYVNFTITVRYMDGTTKTYTHSSYDMGGFLYGSVFGYIRLGTRYFDDNGYYYYPSLYDKNRNEIYQPGSYYGWAYDKQYIGIHPDDLK
ncbi:MAG: hypothetical protein J6N19_03055 [Clostridium sp.]|nr:hypothetical protein [Clostridium sp.]